MFNETTVYIIGHGKTSSDNAITSNFKIFFIGFVVDTETDLVIELECSTTLSLTSSFIRSMFLGKSFAQYDSRMEQEISRRYFGTSQKAVITAYKDGVKKYQEVKQKF